MLYNIHRAAIERFTMRELKATLNDVMQYQHEGVIARIMEEYDTTEEKARALFDEAKEFLFYCALHSPSISRPSVTADLAWHEFILFTRDYAKFCDDHFGFFVHHMPDKLTPKDVHAKRGKVA